MNKKTATMWASIFGVMGGSLMFGFAGMLFAIPTIMISKVIITTMFRQFRAYDII